ANEGRRGAAHLTIPVDVFTREVHEERRSNLADSWPPPKPEIGRALELLHGARRPVAIAVSGVWWGDAADALGAFIERRQIPLYTITMARGTVPDDHPLCMGYADPALNRAAQRAFAEADLFLVVGKRIDYRLAMGGTRLFPADAKFVQID